MFSSSWRLYWSITFDHGVLERFSHVLAGLGGTDMHSRGEGIKLAWQEVVQKHLRRVYRVYHLRKGEFEAAFHGFSMF